MEHFPKANVDLLSVTLKNCRCSPHLTEEFCMRPYLLIPGLSALLCLSSAFAQTSSFNSQSVQYDARWVDAGSACIKELISKAKQKRIEIWTDRFPDVKTLCQDYESYWWHANVYADDVGLSRHSKDIDWVKTSLQANISSKRKLEADRKALKKFREDISSFAGAGAHKLVDRAILRFEPGQHYTMSPPIGPPKMIGDFYFQSPNAPNFWGELMNFK